MTAKDSRLAVARQALAGSKQSDYNERPPEQWHGYVQAALESLLTCVDERETAARVFLTAIHDALNPLDHRQRHLAPARDRRAGRPRLGPGGQQPRRRSTRGGRILQREIDSGGGPGE